MTALKSYQIRKEKSVTRFCTDCVEKRCDRWSTAVKRIWRRKTKPSGKYYRTPCGLNTDPKTA